MILGNPEPIEVKTIESMMSKGLISMGIDSTAFQAAKKMSDKVVSSIIITDSMPWQDNIKTQIHSKYN